MFNSLLEKKTHCEYTIQNTFTFLGKLTISNGKDYTLINFDVSYLFTNVPFTETLSIVFMGLKMDNFNKLLDIAIKDILIIFNGKLCK